MVVVSEWLGIMQSWIGVWLMEFDGVKTALDAKEIS